MGGIDYKVRYIFISTRTVIGINTIIIIAGTGIK